MRDPDVLVAGGGLGGTMAALAAARAEPGATVHLVRQPESPFDRETGLIGVLGAWSGESGPIVDPRQPIDALPAIHPYSVLGSDAVAAGLSRFDEATDGEYRGASSAANGLVPTVLGTPAPAARYPAEVAPGLLSREASTLLVGFSSLPDFHAPFAADRLEAAAVPADVRGVTTTVPVSGHDDAPPLSIAHSLDAAAVADAGQYSAVTTLARRIAQCYEGEARVGLPAVLGVEETAAIHAIIEERLDAAVFELPLPAPSVLGRRLEATLDAALAAADVSVVAGTVESLDTDGEDIERVAVDVAASDDQGGPDPGRVTLAPGAAVLATGGPADGGIVADRTAVREPIAGCPVRGDDETVRAAPDPLGDHPFAHYGVTIDEDARPLTADGEPVSTSLFAAGSIIGGHDAIAEHSRGGVALASGVVAGRQAAECVVHR